MKIAVIGAAGRTGRQVVAHALGRGHEVVAVARSPEKLNIADDRLTVAAADVGDADAVTAAVVGADAIVTTFGAAAGRQPTDIYSVGITNVLAAMDRDGIRRLAVISASPAGPRAEQPAPLRLLVLPILDRFFGAAYADLRRMETVLADEAIWNGPACARRDCSIGPRGRLPARSPAAAAVTFADLSGSRDRAAGLRGRDLDEVWNVVRRELSALGRTTRKQCSAREPASMIGPVTIGPGGDLDRGRDRDRDRTDLQGLRVVSREGWRQGPPHELFAQLRGVSGALVRRL